MRVGLDALQKAPWPRRRPRPQPPPPCDLARDDVQDRLVRVEEVSSQFVELHDHVSVDSREDTS